jgi:hypothetical protein
MSPFDKLLAIPDEKVLEMARQILTKDGIALASCTRQNNSTTTTTSGNAASVAGENGSSSS